MKLYYIIAAVGAAAVVAGGSFSAYQMYRLVRVDAESRGLKRPGLWGAFALSGNNSSGLLLYLIGRRNYPVVSMTEARREDMQARKKRTGVGLAFLAVGAVMCVLSLLLGERFI